MGFSEAFQLIKQLEGVGKVGERYGMTQETWKRLGMLGNVEMASDIRISSAYQQLWESCRIDNPEVGGKASVFDIMGSPADTAAFQCFINLPWKEFHRLVQEAVGVEQDGVFGPQTCWAILKRPPEELTDEILRLQEIHYRETADSDVVDGLLNRVKRVRTWLNEKES